ncbi:MAG: YfhO family protein [Candidatus Dormibacterales bacterium]
MNLPRTDLAGSVLKSLKQRPAFCLAIAAGLLFIALWWRVLIDSRVLIGGDFLYCCPPWSGAAGAHPPTNLLAADPNTQFLPWLLLIRDAFAHGRLPLWNPYSLSGSPLLADDQSAPFSLFTLVALVPGGAWGLSLAALLRLWVAGGGMYLFLRALGSGAVGAVLGGVVMATSSFIVLWMVWPQSEVAALIPGLFAAIELALRRRGALGVVAIAAMVALQFLAGHAETSLYVGIGAGIYVVVRCLDRTPGRLSSLGRIAGGAAVGTLLAGAQLVPFLDNLRSSTLLSDRAAGAMGAGHLSVTALVSWFIPNLRGNPGIDGLAGRGPNYAEATAFIGVAALLLVIPGLIGLYRRLPTAAIGLALIALLAGGIAYGPLTPIAARIPGLDVSGNTRMTVLVCFALAALAGLGFDALARRSSQTEKLWALLGGVAGLGGLSIYATCAVAFALLHQRAENLLPIGPKGVILFWTLAAFVAFAGGAGLIVATSSQRLKAPALAGLATLVLLEAALFAGPYQPQVSPSEVPPHSDVMSWMSANAGDQSIAATGYTLLPEVPSMFGLRDVRAYDLLEPARAQKFWSAADPGYQNLAFYTLLNQPGSQWLAAAGVGLIAVPGSSPLPGTTAAYQAEGMVVSRVPDPRPLAYAAPAVIQASSADDAVGRLRADPLSVVTVEGAGSVAAGTAQTSVVEFSPGSVTVDVTGDSTFVVVLQSFDAGWKAYVDGNPATIHPADVTFMGVQVPAGSHVLHLVYDPESMKVGLAASATGAALLLAIIGTSAFRRSRREQTPESAEGAGQPPPLKL